MSNANKSGERTNLFLQDAYSLDSREQLQTFYENWAREYDSQMEQELGYLAPRQVTTMFLTEISERTSRILDIGCGTGLTSVGLAHAGFENIDGLDFSASMLAEARARGFYQQLILADLNQPLRIDDEVYDAAICTGTFTHGHVHAEPMEEIFRIIRTGGVFVCTIHSAVFVEHGFDTKIDQLIDDGVVEVAEKSRLPYFEGSPPDGWYFTFRKLRSRS